MYTVRVLKECCEDSRVIIKFFVRNCFEYFYYLRIVYIAIDHPSWIRVIRWQRISKYYYIRRDAFSEQTGDVYSLYMSKTTLEVSGIIRRRRRSCDNTSLMSSVYK